MRACTIKHVYDVHTLNNNNNNNNNSNFFYLQVANSPSKPGFKLSQLVRENNQRADCSLKPEESVNIGKNLCRKSLIK